MRRYTLHIRGKEYVIDVQELTADSFEVVVGNEAYAVTLTGDEDVAEAAITPELAPWPSRRPVADGGRERLRGARHRRLGAEPSGRAVSSKSAAPAVPLPQNRLRRRAALNAPMPGVIVEIHAKAGDS
jgi:biotin carboxyl carrier protein